MPRRVTSLVLAVAAWCAWAAAPPAALAAPARTCRTDVARIARLQVVALRRTPAAGAVTCRRANAVARAWMERFAVHRSARRIAVAGVDYACTRAPTATRNTRCDGGGSRVAFAAPLGD